MQAYSPITEGKVVPMNFIASGDNQYAIEATEIKNIPEQFDVYLTDNLRDLQFDLRNGKQYSFASEGGEFPNRFEVVFKANENALTLDVDTSRQEGGSNLYFNSNDHNLYFKDFHEDVKSIYILSMSGQTVQGIYAIRASELQMGVPISELSSGTYIACVVDYYDNVITKKFIYN